MKETHRFVRLLAAALAAGAALLTSGCKSSSAAQAEATQRDFAKPGALTAAVLLPKDAPQTPALQNGMRLAQETVNAKGGVLGYPLDIKFSLCGPDDPEGLEALEAAMGKKPSVLWVGGDLAVYAGPALLDKPVLACFLSEYPPVPGLLPTGVRIFPNGPSLAQSVFDVAHTTDITSVAIIYCTGPVNQSLCAYLAFLMQGDGIRVYRDQFSAGESNFAMLSEYLKRMMPDAVYLIGPPADCDRLAAAILKVKYPNLVMGIFPQPPRDDEDFAAFKTRVVYSRPDAQLAPDFVAAYRRRFGKMPDLMAAYGYDNVMRVAAAADMARSRAPEAIRAALLEQKATYAIPGLAFEKDGDTSVPLALHVPEGVKLPERVPPRTENMMEKRDAPILLLDPYKPEGKE